MHPSRNLLLALSSLLNAAICFLAFWFAVFATSPGTQDVAMRFGFYVVNAIAVAAFFGIVAPWFFTSKGRLKFALFLAALPAILVCLTVLAFLRLDSWLQRAFG